MKFLLARDPRINTFVARACIVCSMGLLIMNAWFTYQGIAADAPNASAISRIAVAAAVTIGEMGLVGGLLHPAGLAAAVAQLSVWGAKIKALESALPKLLGFGLLLLIVATLLGGCYSLYSYDASTTAQGLGIGSLNFFSSQNTGNEKFLVGVFVFGPEVLLIAATLSGSFGSNGQGLIETMQQIAAYEKMGQLHEGRRSDRCTTPTTNLDQQEPSRSDTVDQLEELRRKRAQQKRNGSSEHKRKQKSNLGKYGL